MMITIANLIRAAEKSAERDEALAARHADPLDWQRRHYYESRAAAARRLIVDLREIAELDEIARD